MLVTATAKGFYIGSREPGETFDFDVSILKRKGPDGQPVMPSWLREATPADAEKFGAAQAGADERRASTLSGITKGAAEKSKGKKEKKAEAGTGSEDLV